MIVVVGSRHDPSAAALVERWPDAALCSAEDLARPGWIWGLDPSSPRQWVVGGDLVDDERVTGVFVRRSAVYPQEFPSTHPDDRAYLAAEAHAFLVFVLDTTRATVASPVADGALGDEALRPERWVPAAVEAGVAVAPLRLTDRPRRRRIRPLAMDVVGAEAFGDASERVKAAALRMVGALGLPWATLIFDGRRRLLTIATTREPGPGAVEALGCLLAARIAA